MTIIVNGGASTGASISGANGWSAGPGRSSTSVSDSSVGSSAAQQDSEITIDWFALDPEPRFLVDRDGGLLAANPAGDAALRDGQLTVSSSGELNFGSVECDARFLAALHGVSDPGDSSRAVLRQRHGGWFAADIHVAPDGLTAVVCLKVEPVASEQVMAAIGAAFQLTASELCVLHELLSGRCPKAAAIALHISEHTVRAHLRSLYGKMNVRGLSATIRLCCSLL